MATIKKNIKKAEDGRKIASDNTMVKKPIIRNLKKEEALEKLKIAKDLYKDNPSKVYKDAVDSAKARLSRVPKQRSGGKVSVAKEGKWIQKATASIKKRGTEGVCTGSKFGGPTCKPGSKRYNLAKTFRKMSKKK
jgi:hypothetical protein